MMDIDKIIGEISKHKWITIESCPLRRREIEDVYVDKKQKSTRTRARKIRFKEHYFPMHKNSLLVDDKDEISTCELHKVYIWEDEMPETDRKDAIENAFYCIKVTSKKPINFLMNDWLY